MSLTLSPYGLKLVEYKGGKNRVSTSKYTILSGYNYSIGQGDPVCVINNGNVAAYSEPVSPTSPNVGLYASNTLGVAVSFSWISTTGVAMNNQPYWPAGTLTLNNVPAVVQVADLFSNVYRIQCNASLGLTSPSTATFKNYNFTNCLTTSLPNARTSQSTAALDISAGGIAAPNYWYTAKIVGLAPESIIGGPNSWYDTYPEVHVMINAHAFKPGTNGSN